MNNHCEKSELKTKSKESLEQQEQQLVNSGHYLSIYFVTWNVASKEPRGSFADLFNFYHRLYDAYVIVLEEMPMKTYIYIDGWRSSMEQLFRQVGYVLLRKESAILTGVFLFVRRQDIYRYSSVQTYPVKLQSDRAFAFKGAVGLRFVYHRIRVAIIGAHLTPHDENYQKRIKDLRTIMSEVYFSNRTDTVHNQDITFLIGDLNFRLDPMNESKESYDEEKEFESIVQFIRENRNNKDPKRYESLLKYDQIRKAQQKGDIPLKDYEESSISFAPTFKFVIDSCDQYDRKRRPAWTDRILWRNLLKFQSRWQKTDHSKMSSIEPISMYYDSLPQYTTSDHKPVRQLIWIPIMEMKEIKKDLNRKRRDTRRLTLPTLFDQLPQPPSTVASYQRLRSDSVTTFLPATTTDEFPMDMISNELSSIDTEIEANENSLLWPNIDDPSIFQPTYRIEFFRIPDWNRTKKFYANFKIVTDDDDDDNHERRPVSIRNPSVRKFIDQWDWIGIFPEKFTSLDDFLTYSYPRFGNALPTEQAADALSMLNIDDDDNIRDFDDDSQQGDQQSSRSSNKEETSSIDSSSITTTTTTSIDTTTDEVFSVHFDEQIPILAGRYLLIYIRKNGDVIGISEPFDIERDIDLSSDIS
uniref:Uncharacterized protein LOC113792440 n=1 Tax=Dermatophagoides pteronyssinus TaxID=6956 RepID=A0A6P6Y1E6_DERPT|nr:uncharacterized protein LOC113792440 [Dermatophagoides pteronyssinus]